MFVQGVIISSATLVSYLLWLIWFLPFDFNQDYDFTVLSEACLVLCCLLLDTTDGNRIINLSLAAAILSSVVFRFIGTDCTGCAVCDTYVGTCLHNGCGCSPRNGTKMFLYIIPLATVLFRVTYTTRRTRDIPT
jgi:hypothetical protein